MFIIVRRDTAIARELFDWPANDKSGYGAAPEQFLNEPGREWTVRVDNKVAEDIAEGGGKNDAARCLRFILETNGKAAWPGNRTPEEYTALVGKHNHKAFDDDSGGG